MSDQGRQVSEGRSVGGRWGGDRSGDWITLRAANGGRNSA